jgi:hypothetical protein
MQDLQSFDKTQQKARTFKDMRAFNILQTSNLFKRLHINNIPKPYLFLQHFFERLVNILYLDHLDFGMNIMFGTEVKHFLGFGNASYY